MSPDTSALHSSVAAAVAAVLEAMVAVASRSKKAAVRLRRWVSAAAGALWTRTRRAADVARRVVSGPVRRTVTGPLRVAVVGRRTDVSLLAALLSPALALVVAWWVGSSVGYSALEAAVRGTWTGTDPAVGVFVAAGALLALGAANAGVNSGLLPTTLLVAAPVFGAAATRYGTRVAYETGAAVVSLPEAVAVAAAVAVAVGAPLGVAAFCLGAAVRRVVRVVGRGPGSSSRPDKA
ncbi:hypothetical protein [Halobaculum sp. D14]|uniref:hypothetical protein n=1 Tax=unclassified Halobaculum TaxID=2640896 RepID=UPI003EB85ED3